jgi:hypothetical protein
MVMLYREEKMILYKGDVKQETKPQRKEDDYFVKNFDLKFGKTY